MLLVELYGRVRGALGVEGRSQRGVWAIAGDGRRPSATPAQYLDM